MNNDNNNSNPLESTADSLLMCINTFASVGLQIASNLIVLGGKATWCAVELVSDCIGITYRVCTGTYNYENEKKGYYIEDYSNCVQGGLCRTSNKPIIEYNENSINNEYIEIETFESMEIPKTCKYKSNKDDIDNTLKAYIGVGERNKQQCIDFYKDGSLLIGGASRWGKTSLIYSLLLSLMDRYSSKYLRIILVDFKQVDLVRVDKYNHVTGECIIDSERFIGMLSWAEAECDNRVKILKSLDASNIQEFNNISNQKLQPIIIVIDEIAQVLCGEKKETDKIKTRLHKLICKSMAFGLYFVVCTQELSRDTLGKMKINFTQSIGLKCVDRIASDLIMKDGDLENIKVKGRAKIDNSEGTTEFQTYLVKLEEFNEYLKDNKKE